jgi:hypothetical protein
MAVAERPKYHKNKPLRYSTVPSGERDEFARRIACAETHREARRRQSMWIGILFLAVLVVALFATCVHMRQFRPVPGEHALPFGRP